MMSKLPTVTSLHEAESWFVLHQEGRVRCVDGKRVKVCETFYGAKAFFQEEKCFGTDAPNEGMRVLGNFCDG